MIQTETATITGDPSQSDTQRHFIDGSSRSHVLLRSAVIGLGTYQPGWRWSLHAGPQTGKPTANHIGYILSGCMMIQDANGIRTELGPGQAFEGVVPANVRESRSL